MIKVKICGITRPEDANAAVDEGADYLGFVFAPSPRQVDEKQARLIMDSMPGFKNWVGVFVNADRFDVVKLCSSLRISFLQLHGNETPEECFFLQREGFQVIKAHCIQNAASFDDVSKYETPYILFDSYSKHREGGTGKAFDWNLLKGRSFNSRVFLSGGLKSGLMPDALCVYVPYAVDISSGVEDCPGQKNPAKIREFIRSVRKFDTKKSESQRHG